MMKTMKSVLCLILAVMLLICAVPVFAEGDGAAEKVVRKPRINIAEVDVFPTSGSDGGFVWLEANGEFESYGQPATLYVDLYKGSKRIFRHTDSLRVSEDEIDEWEFYGAFENKNGKSVVKPKTKYKVKIYIKSKKKTSKVISISFKTPAKWW